MLICAQSGRFLGRERKTDPASSARSSRKGLNDIYSRVLGIVNNFFVSFLVQKVRFQSVGGSTVTALK